VTDVLRRTLALTSCKYSGLLSGIGIRGFGPQFSGINKRALLLIDGRPSGITNSSTLLLDNVDHIEVVTDVTTAAFDHRCIPPRGVARRSNTPGHSPSSRLAGRAPRRSRMRRRTYARDH
jgi:hypothetical protein